MDKLIKTLSDMRAVSGFEYRISENIAELFRPYSDEVRIDTLGSVIAVKRCGRENAPRVMIEAHTDEIGLMVKDIDERGFITFVNVGGVDPRILPSAEVTIHGKHDVLGIIGAKPPHLQSAGESAKSAKITDMAIDVGMSADEVREIISVGDSITLPQSWGMLDGGQFSGKSLDDRASVALLIDVMKRLERVKLDVDVYAVAAVQEEVGCRGAQTAAFEIDPTVAVAVDVCHAVTPDNSYNAFDAGSGVVMSIGPNIHPAVQKRLSDTASKYNIKTSTDVDGGETGTDAWTIQVARCGIPTGLLSIPLKYMHTSVETLDIEDVKSASSLLTFFIQDFCGEEWLCF